MFGRKNFVYLTMIILLTLLLALIVILSFVIDGDKRWDRIASTASIVTGLFAIGAFVLSVYAISVAERQVKLGITPVIMLDLHGPPDPKDLGYEESYFLLVNRGNGPAVRLTFQTEDKHKLLTRMTERWPSAMGPGQTLRVEWGFNWLKSLLTGNFNLNGHPEYVDPSAITVPVFIALASATLRYEGVDGTSYRSVVVLELPVVPVGHDRLYPEFRIVEYSEV